TSHAIFCQRLRREVITQCQGAQANERSIFKTAVRISRIVDISIYRSWVFIGRTWTRPTLFSIFSHDGITMTHFGNVDLPLCVNIIPIYIREESIQRETFVAK